MEIVTGDENGIVKVVDPKNKGYINYGDNWSRQEAVVGLAKVEVGEGALPVHLGSLRRSGSFDLWRRFDNGMLQLRRTIDLGLTLALNSVTIPQSSRMLAYNAEGVVKIYSPFDEESEIDVSTYSTRGPVAAGAACSDGAIFGGKENDILMYDLKTFQNVWKAKNVPHDYLNLRLPIYHTCLKYLDASESSVARSLILSGTGHKQVRLYDTRVGIQPILSIDISEEYRVTTLLPLSYSAGADPLSTQLVVGDNAGGMHLWDLRNKRNIKTLKGFTGSIRDIQLSEDKKHIAAVGLDRFLRAYNAQNFQIESSSYLKTKLNRCLFWTPGESSGDSDGEEEEGDEEDDDDDEDSDSEGEGEKRRGRKAAEGEDTLEAFVDSDEEDEDSDSEEEEEEDDEEDEEEDDDDDSLGMGEEEEEDWGSKKKRKFGASSAGMRGGGSGRPAAKGAQAKGNAKKRSKH